MKQYSLRILRTNEATHNYTDVKKIEYTFLFARVTSDNHFVHKHKAIYDTWINLMCYSMEHAPWCNVNFNDIIF